MNPTINGLNSLDVAVLLEKAILLNGMLVHGTPEQKLYAKQQWMPLETEIKQHINIDACEMAKRELALDHDSINLEMFDFVCK